MSLHINKFIDRIKANESRGQRDFTMTMTEAKDLHADITKLLLGLHVLHEQSRTAPADSQVVDLQVEGGTFK